MSKSLFILLTISSYIINAYQLLARDDIHVEVHVVDGLPNNDIPIKFHCASKDDDLGWHYPKVGDDFYFHFLPSIFGNTLYFCHFWWGYKQAAFDVYTNSLGANCSNGYPINYCIWKFQEDGFYMGPQLDQLKKKHDWY
ncbi:unnamed protein product [Withania somnifera]